jgi:hypothetical protein
MLYDYKCRDIAKGICWPIVICGYNDINLEKHSGNEFSEIFLPNGSSYYCALRNVNGKISIDRINGCNKLEIKNKKCTAGTNIKGNDDIKVTSRILGVINNKSSAIFLYKNKNDSWSVGLWDNVSAPATPSAPASRNTDQINAVSNNSRKGNDFVKKIKSNSKKRIQHRRWRNNKRNIYNKRRIGYWRRGRYRRSQRKNDRALRAKRINRKLRARRIKKQDVPS